MINFLVHVIGSWFDKQQMNVIKSNGNTSFNPGILPVKRWEICADNKHSG